MAAFEKSPTPAGMNVMALVVALAVLIVAVGCWVDDGIRRHVRDHAATSHARIIAPERVAPTLDPVGPSVLPATVAH